MKKFNHIYISILSIRTYQKRQKIITIFNKAYNKDIIKELQKYFSGKTSFDEFINGLFTNPREYDCVSLHKANKSITSDIRTVIEIIVIMPSFMFNQILQKYPEIYKGKDLIKDIESCSSGIIRKILIALIENNKGSKKWEGNRLSQIIFVVLSPNEFFATKVNKGVKKTKKLL